MISRSLLLIFLVITSSFLSRSEETKSGLITISVANIRQEPRHSSEMVSQAFCGTPIEILGIEGEWYRIKMPDNYEGYVHQSSISEKTHKEMILWRASDRIMIMVPETIFLLSDTLKIAPINQGGFMISDLTGGCILEVVEKLHNYSLVKMPDGRQGYIDNDTFLNLYDWASQGTDTQECISFAKAQNGVPYLWGGISPKGVDCSGLVKNSYYATGLILERDASQQAETGIDIPAWRPDLWKTGDLLFFTGDDDERITHVAIYDRNGEFIHSSGRVQLSNINPSSENYLDRKVVKVCRIRGSEGTPGIQYAKNHPWYFNIPQ